ncbi:P63C domain-containing protein [Xenorhabdus bovienii]|uniref:P63C domain-containing protein n=2 Tax=Xenorhabdus bovienii TaxID=40576 RepID=UPI00237C987B|nr:P63C domain-containing protein [Xenorhabdus bovienii]MDE1486070.1 P63C domain-containing protein [Xenorhabdus bovienii]MDE9478807.1 P63C domain-containing protein [Xenorhabdus bovienii]MDE9483268.1 P63C domain-containing protein [Xenorhabdus bovienii]MDE9531731.1 P63C domain-containing protein [Xenorhabdus bovienii]MDE9537249.1 P63C domain-containing protein [Xenorhabdus bovienii]
MSSEEKEIKGKAKGGIARAKTLTSERRSEIAKNAAAERWKNKPHKATHKGNFKEEFGIDAECYILDDQNKTAVVTKKGLAQLLSIGDHGRDVDQLLTSQYMSNYVDLKLLEKIRKPIIFQYIGGSKNFNGAHGFDITLIGDIASALIAADRDKVLPKSRKECAKLAQQLANASMKAGLKGLAYAVAGYRPEVQEVIEAFKAFVREEARGYEKEFPDELYSEWYRLYGLEKFERGRPILFAQLTRKHVYYSLAKSEGKVLELAVKNKNENGKESDKIHQFLSEVGVKALRRHIGKVLGVAIASDTKEEYERIIKTRMLKEG